MFRYLCSYILLPLQITEEKVYFAPFNDPSVANSLVLHALCTYLDCLNSVCLTITK